ncbi:hypothetical protein [Pseudomonas mediterranea]|uniref:Prophage protein n=1 Tax=Pseudomonas mediterranea TaxID=183795 RepID=A0AAX2DED7_9PSED|nr:hypothetical protein [Pseudomonas mediterranea]KGU87235.1 prophage PssSM-02 [Pseudomonas mediterranea CFBP 5447]SDU61975.1 hypothetical protein SAMN05216476_3699 [Pseudomonas mediterranea]
MSPHILIDEELAILEDRETPVNWSVMIQKQLTEMMADQRITIDEFTHYCGRLNKIVARRKELS